MLENEEKMNLQEAAASEPKGNQSAIDQSRMDIDTSDIIITGSNTTRVCQKEAQKSVWINSALFSKWHSKDFIPILKKLHERERKTGKVLLILDNARCHPPVEILNAIDDNFSLMYLPPNITALVQPMDQGVIEKLKRIYRKQVLGRFIFGRKR
ncbi:HTH CENPB-type domain-containing protein [Trichonephila clavipes]|nr:HTH CENPB-type domain-containing protein [Trichonephila clavipes]